MKTSKSLKQALFMSLLSILLCVSMLIGSTFAWFTDTASTAVNSIQSGTIDIRLTDLEGNNMEGKTLNWVDAKGNSDILWEPGCTFITEPVTLWNYSNLSFALSTNVTGFSGDTKLLEAIEWKIADYDKIKDAQGNLKSFDEIEESYLSLFTEYYDGFPMQSWQYGLQADWTNDSEGVQSAHPGVGQPKPIENVCIVAHMKEDAGNEYQGLTLTGAALYFRAAQLADEYDSYGNEYDAAATYDEVATNQGELDGAVANATEPTTVVLPAGNYNVPAMTDKDVTFKGDKDTVVDMSTAVGANDSAVTFDGVTIVYDNDAYEGLQHSAKEVYKNCTIKGTMFLYAPEVEFINCTFEEYDATTEYSVWTYGATDVTFTGCTFNTHGKAILVYTEGETHADITLTGCTFNGDKTVATTKAAVEVGASANSTATTYNLTFTSCTTNDGFVANNSTSALWGNKNSMDKDHLNVIIDGTDVY